MDYKIGDILTLMWVSKNRGKQKLARYGTQWRLERIADTVAFAPGIKGPWLMVDSLKTKLIPCPPPGDDCMLETPVDGFWFLENGDPDFKIESPENV